MNSIKAMEGKRKGLEGLLVRDSDSRRRNTNMKEQSITVRFCLYWILISIQNNHKTHAGGLVELWQKC